VRDFLGAVFMGAALGVAATMFYVNNEQDVRRGSRRIKARSKNAVNFVTNLGDEVNEMIKR